MVRIINNNIQNIYSCVKGNVLGKIVVYKGKSRIELRKEEKFSRMVFEDSELSRVFHQFFGGYLPGLPFCKD